MRYLFVLLATLLVGFGAVEVAEGRGRRLFGLCPCLLMFCLGMDPAPLPLRAARFMTKEGDLSADEPVWYGKSVIHTCCQLDYRTAQDMIDETIRMDENTGECIGLDTWEEHRRPTGGHKMADVIDDVKLLNRIAQRRRALRMGAGAFRLTTKQLTFKLDSETRNPVSAGAYIIRAANQLVEEYVAK